MATVDFFAENLLNWQSSMSDDEEDLDLEANGVVPRGPRDITTYEKWAIVSEYCLLLEPGADRLKRGELQKIAEKFEVVERSVGYIIRDYTTQRANGVRVPDLEPNRKGRCGRELQLDDDLALCLVEFNSMTYGKLTIRRFCVDFEKQYGIRIPLTTLHRYLHKLGVKTVTPESLSLSR